MAKITLYGRLVDLAGTSELAVSLSGGSRALEGLLQQLEETQPELVEELRKPSIRLVINDVLDVSGNSISDSDEVAFLPPVSGG